jgi:putative flippase GtrA
VRQHAAGAVVYLIALGLTAGALDVVAHLDRNPSRLLEVVVLVAATTVATVTRYMALRSWVFAQRRRVAGMVRASAR